MAMRVLVPAITLVLSVAMGLSVVPALGQFGPGDRTPGLKNEIPAPIKGMDLINKLGDRVATGVTLIDSSGKAVLFSSLLNRPALDASGASLGHNRPVVLLLVYFRCPLLCPMVLEKFTTTLKAIDFTIGREYDVVVVSFDQRDRYTDASAQRNAQIIQYGCGDSPELRAGMSYLVGEPEQVRTLADSVGFPYRYLTEAGEFAHPSAVFVLTPDGRVSRTLTGLMYPATDVRLALLEASSGKIGSLFDKFTLWCFHFDPLAATYTMRVMRVMQVAAGATVMLLGGGIGLFLIRERRKARVADAEAASVRAGKVTVGTASG